MFLQQLLDNFNKPKTWLILINIFLVSLLIIFNNLKIIPLRTGDFIFFVFLFLALAIFRPGWAFLFFIGMIPLENINLAPENWGVMIRPYQFIGALTIVAIVIRFFSKKLNFELIKLKWYDLPIILLNIGGVLGLINAPNRISSLKLLLVLVSFSILYFLTRNFIQNFEDLKKIIPLFLSSSAVVVVYGIWQNFRFRYELPSFEVMLGRPNSTFSEPDWLGMYLALLISFIYIMMYTIFNTRNERYVEDDIFKTKHLFFAFLYVLLFSSYILLIIIVTRSAWLGALAATFFFLFAILTQLRFIFKKMPTNDDGWQWGKMFEMKMIIIPLFVIAVVLVYCFHLTNFQLVSRVQSTASGLQKITVSCGFPSGMHKKMLRLKSNDVFRIENLDELKGYNCKHINLEEIEKEQKVGRIIYDVYRPDPNIAIRLKIYQKSLQEIKNHPILGIGWGSISDILGKDNRGEKLNSSNIFFEAWLGSGILGVVSILFLFAYVLLTAVKKYYFSTTLENKFIALFLFVSSFAIIIPNLFNAGIFLGFLWVWLAVAIFLSKISNNYL
jgi:hypothetical protein